MFARLVLWLAGLVGAYDPETRAYIGLLLGSIYFHVTKDADEVRVMLHLVSKLVDGKRTIRRGYSFKFAR